jgi:hypothetical protein
MCRGTGFYSVPCVTNLKAAPCDELAIRSIPPGTNCVARQKPWVLLAAILASSITHIDGSVVNIALPAIESNLATSVAVIQWLVNAYTLCLSALLLTGGVAADRFGRRKMFIIGLILFAAASLWCGFALSIALRSTALGATFFFLPFALIQVGGYSAVRAGATFLPFTFIIGLLSRWSGGLVDRVGARLPLIIGPMITALASAH